MPPTYFPLRWESTGDQWWYASPIDWAVANGHYDLVLELLRIDGNHLIKLTSLRRIRRLESVWDDEVQFYDVAMCRSLVARKLLLQFNTKNGNNSLIQAGYGGWLMYTAASAGDLGFVQQLLERNPLLVFGEGEYGVTDILYAAARSKNSEVFRLLFEFAVSPRFVMAKSGELVEHIGNNIPSVYKWEMINRAIHAAARGGNLKILKELLADCSDVLTYRDVYGSTILHTAAGRGKVEVLNYLIDTCEIMTSTDHLGNTALHVAAHRGQLAAVEALISLSPSSVYSRNSDGETFLHKAVSGFQTHSFRRLDKQIDLLKQLVCGKIFCVQDIINAKNKVERTALHMAIIGNIHSDLVKLLMTAQSIDVNVRDAHDMTPLDYLRQRPQSASSDILIRQLISAGGIISCQDYSARKVFASCLKMQSNGISPGTSFRISDREIFLHTGIELNISHPSNLELGSPGIELNISHPNDLEQGSSGMSSSSVEQSSCGSTDGNHISFASTKPGSINSAAKILKSALQWRKIKEKQTKKFKNSDDTPTQQKNRFFNISALAKKKRTLSDRCNQSNPPAKKKFASGLRSGVMQVIPHNTNQVDIENEIARLSCSNQVDCDYSTQYFEKQSYVSKQRMRRKYFCFGKSRCFSVNDPVSMQLPVASVA